LKKIQNKRKCRLKYKLQNSNTIIKLGLRNLYSSTKLFFIPIPKIFFRQKLFKWYFTTSGKFCKIKLYYNPWFTLFSWLYFLFIHKTIRMFMLIYFYMYLLHIMQFKNLLRYWHFLPNCISKIYKTILMSFTYSHFWYTWCFWTSLILKMKKLWLIL
jgi:hypothetical protein